MSLSTKEIERNEKRRREEMKRELEKVKKRRLVMLSMITYTV